MYSGRWYLCLFAHPSTQEAEAGQGAEQVVFPPQVHLSFVGFLKKNVEEGEDLVPEEPVPGMP